MGSVTKRLTSASARRPWLVIGLWVATIAVAGALSSQFLADGLTMEAGLTNPETVRATELVEERGIGKHCPPRTVGVSAVGHQRGTKPEQPLHFLRLGSDPSA